MPRTIKTKCPEAPKTTGLRGGHVRKTYNIEVITPLFGGSAKKGQPDSFNPIRVTSIRGHLRFWWRATKGRELNDAAQLYAAETKLWGDTSNPSPVVITAVVDNRGRTYPCANAGHGHPQFQQHHPAYALFPFQGNARQQQPPSNCIAGISFKLGVDCPAELMGDVETAIKAWVNFGGIGARTRRGCGALFCANLAPADEKDLAHFRPFLLQHTDRKWATLRRILIDQNTIGQTSEDILELWNNLVSHYRAFRQSRNQGQQRNRPGRSHWPEPDTIRRLTGRNAPQHQPDPAMPDACPRAELGLPIIVDFRDRERQEPPNSQILPADANLDRFSSPLILRPVKCRNGHALNLALILGGPLPVTVRVKSDRGEYAAKVRPAVNARGEYGPKVPLNGKTKNGSALEAFAAFQSNAFHGEEVK